MSFSLVQSLLVNTEFSGTGGVTTAGTFGAPVAVGDTILLQTTVGTDPASLAPQLTDQLGNFYDHKTSRFLSGDGQGYDYWSCIATHAGTPTVTYTPNGVTGQNFIAIKGDHFTGSDSASTVRVVDGATQTHPGTGANAITTPSVAALAGDLQWAAVGVQGPEATVAIGTGFTATSAVDGTTGFLTEFKTASGAGASTFTDATGGGTHTYATGTIVITPAGSGGGTPVTGARYGLSPIPMRAGPLGLRRGKPFRFDTSRPAGSVTINGDSSQPLPFGRSADASVLVQGASSNAIPFGTSAAGGTGANGDSSLAIPFGSSADGAVLVQAASSVALPFGRSADASVLVQAASSSPLPFGSSANGVVSPVTTAPYRMMIPMRPTAGGLVIARPFRFATSQPAGASSTVTGDSSTSIAFGTSASGQVAVQGASSSALPFGSTASATVLVQGASSNALPISSSEAGAVAVQGASSQPIPFGTSASGVLGNVATGDSNKPLPISGAANGTVLVQAASSQPIPFGMSAAGVLGNVSTGDSTRAIPFGTSATASVGVQGTSVAALPIGRAAAGAVLVQAASNTAIPFGTSATATTQRPVNQPTTATATSVQTYADQLDSHGVPMQVTTITFTQFETGPIYVQISDADGNVVDPTSVVAPKVNVRARHGRVIVDHADAQVSGMSFVWNRQDAEVARACEFVLQIQGTVNGEASEMPTGGISGVIKPAVAALA